MFIILLLLWLIFAGGVSANALLTGSLVSAAITFFCSRFMGYTTAGFLAALKKGGQLFLYLLVLLKEILLANFYVLKIIYRRKEPKPVLISFASDIKSEGLRVLVANSITLTPGTYTVELEGGDYVVHALDESLGEGIEKGVFFKMAKRMEES